MTTRILPLLACALFAACGNQPLATDADGKYSVTGRCQPAQLAQALVDHGTATLVVDFGPATKEFAKTIKSAKRATPPYAITVGPHPRDGEEIPDAVIVLDHGARAAVDLALLACNGVALQPNLIEVGTRTVTPANRKSGGNPRIAPGDVMLAMMKLQHEKLLTTKPETDQVHSIGWLPCDPKADWQAALGDGITRAAARYPQLQVQTVGNDRPALEQAAQLLKKGCRALLVATTDVEASKAIQAIAAKGPNGGVPVLILDPTVNDNHGACVIGCSTKTIGLAAASIVRELLPEGGVLLTCFGDGTDDQVRGFCEAMGFAPNRLLSR